MKKVLSLLMILMLLVSFAGCTNQEKATEVANKEVETTEEKATEEKSIFPLTIKDKTLLPLLYLIRCSNYGDIL